MMEEGIYNSRLEHLRDLEELADQIEEFANGLGTLTRRCQCLEPLVEDLASDIENWVDHSLYPLILKPRQQITDHEDLLSETKMRLAPVLADRAPTLRDVLLRKEINLTDPLMHELALHEHLRHQLVERFPDADEETLRDTLEGLTDLQEKLCAIIRSQRDDETLAEALKTRIAEMQGRLRRLTDRVEKKRDLVTTVMERAEIDRIIQAEFTVSTRRTPPDWWFLTRPQYPMTIGVHSPPSWIDAN